MNGRKSREKQKMIVMDADFLAYTCNSTDICVYVYDPK